jgi:hypothetical protein
VTLTRDQILGSRRDRKPVPLDVPEWGGQVYVRVMSAKDQVELTDGHRPTDIPMLVLIHCLVDENGQQILEEGDIDALSQEDFPVIMRLFAFVAKLNGLSTTELDEAMERFTPAPDESRSFA